jgi:WD40 repeat protein
LEHGGANQLLWQPQGKNILRLLTSIEPIPVPLVLIDSESGEVAHALNGHQGAVWRAAWSPDGKRCASVGDDATCRIWDAASGTELLKLTHSDPLWWVQWSGDGTKVATGSSFSAISVWDVVSGKLLREFKTLSKPMSAPRTVTAADGLFGFLKGDTQLFYMAGDDGFEVLDLKSGQISSLGQVDQLGGNRQSAAWSKDFGLLGVYDGYNEFHLYAAGDTKPVTSIRYFMNPHWLADGKRVFGGDNSSTWLCGYDLRRKKRQGVLIPELGTNSWVALSSDGHFAGSPDAKDHLVVVAMHRDGRLLTMTLDEFQTQFKWVNAPEKVRLLE